jgi:hypothetical protein
MITTPPGVTFAAKPTASRKLGYTTPNYYDYPTGIAAAGDGSIVFSGIFEWTIDFGGGQLSELGRSGFIAKLDASEQHVFSKPLPTSQYGGVAVDSKGMLWLASTYTGTVDFAGVPLVADSNENLAVAKFDASGTLLWVVSETSVRAAPVGITVDSGRDARRAAL